MSTAWDRPRLVNFVVTAWLLGPTDAEPDQETWNVMAYTPEHAAFIAACSYLHNDDRVAMSVEVERPAMGVNHPGG